MSRASGGAPLAGDDLHAWLETVASNRLSPSVQASRLGQRACRSSDAGSSPTPPWRQPRSPSPGLKSSGPGLKSSASAPGGGDFFLYRGMMLPRGRWENDPLRTEVSSLQREMRNGRDTAASMQHRTLQSWNPMSAAASAVELRYGYRWGKPDAGGAADRLSASAPSLGTDTSLPPPPRTAGLAATLRSASPRAASPTRPPFSEMLGGHLYEELPPPPPESEVPDEYHLYDLNAERKPLSVGGEAGKAYRVFPAVVPSNRSQVVHLASTLEAMLEAAGPRTPQALQAWDLCLSELVRQVFVQCNDRGELLGRVRRAYQHYLAQLLRKVQQLEATERELELRQLREEVDELRARLGETTQAVKKSRMVGMLRGAMGGSASALKAREASAHGHAAGANAAAMVTAFQGATQHEREAIWADMIAAIPLKQKVQLLDYLWGMLPDERQPQLIRALLKSLSLPSQALLAGDTAEGLPLEERQAFVEKLLRALLPQEMEGFVDFLPWIWGEYKLAHVAKLYAALDETERKRVLTMVALGTVEPANSGPPPDRLKPAAAAGAPGAAAPAAAGAARAAVATADAFTQTDRPPAARVPLGAAPATAPAAAAAAPAAPAAPAAAEAGAPAAGRLEETPPALIAAWARLSPTDGGGEPLSMAAFLDVSADCYEGALTSLKNSPAKKANWPKAVFNTLLRRAGEAKSKKGGGEKKGRSKGAMASAREALHALLRAAQLHAPLSARAQLFARLCGVSGDEYAEGRVERVLRVLSRLYPESPRRVREVMAQKEVYVPMHGTTANIALVLRSMVDELGAEAHAMLARDLEAAALDDPAGDTGSKRLPLEAALLAVVEKYDVARALSGSNLRGVFKHFDVDGSGHLDLPEFTLLMKACDAALPDEQVRQMFIDCTKLSRKLEPELADDLILADAFVQACENYGLQMRVQSTVVTS